ncbi:MAG TPA: hypothetical protein VMB74_17215 [Streptosporangiaceae bacterium]|nr:hypothetical protein [Streptosporangiaceae bacterium]
MRVRQTGVASQRLAASLSVAAVVIAGTLTLSGCSGAKSNAASIQDCGTSRTAANVPVEVEIYRGTVSCKTAMAVEASYATAIKHGDAPGNGGGGPVSVSGWTCQGFATPELLKTGDTSKCAKKGTEILEILKTSSS